MKTSALVLLILLLACGTTPAQRWVALGPNGGDARSLALDPQHPGHIFLGTSTGTIFHSVDGGQNWSRFVHLGRGNDYVIDQIVVDPANSDHLFVCAWNLASHRKGDLFESHDGGKHWKYIPPMHGKSIRAMAVAPADSNIIVVGALDGVFRSEDGGRRWEKISARRSDIKNVESIAIDPKNSQVVYAGTWHLAWKTSDKGRKWRRVQRGIIDDSDVFSILVDQSNSQTIFASACSGIYKSLDGGATFERLLEIPFSARRTHVLRQDPNNPAVVYAGTTEGLWVTKDSGSTWKRVSDREIVVNDVLIDPRDSSRVLMASDRAGVLASRDSDLIFRPSNSGFSHRYISSILVDRNNRDTIYVGVVNDREFGGVFVSDDSGQHWEQAANGLGGRDVFALKQAGDGSILAGTNRGVFVLPRGVSEWQSINDTVRSKVGTSPEALESLKVNDIEVTSAKWFVATSAGLFTTSNEGRNWAMDIHINKQDLIAVRAKKDKIVVASPRKVFFSARGGDRWTALKGLPSYVDSIQNVVITPDGEIIIGSSEGVFRRMHTGWTRVQLERSGGNINLISYDETNQRLLAAGSMDGSVFESRDGGRRWRRDSDTGYPLRHLSATAGRLLASTLFDGIVLQTTEHEH